MAFTTFTNGTVANATEVNNNFNSVCLKTDQFQLNTYHSGLNGPFPTYIGGSIIFTPNSSNNHLLSLFFNTNCWESGTGDRVSCLGIEILNKTTGEKALCGITSIPDLNAQRQPAIADLDGTSSTIVSGTCHIPTFTEQAELNSNVSAMTNGSSYIIKFYDFLQVDGDSRYVYIGSTTFKINYLDYGYTTNPSTIINGSNWII